MKRPVMRVGLGYGPMAWLSVELDSLQFILEPENGEGAVETLTLEELQDRYHEVPIVLGLVAGVLAQAVKSSEG